MHRFLFLMLLAGCQCLVPVSEGPLLEDGGAGDDAGPPPECRAASDCPKVTAPRACAFGGPTPARSCFDGRCVFDCEGQRTCTTATGSCASCDGGTPTCLGSHCSWINSGTTGRLYSSCDAGQSSTRLGPFEARYRQGATCNFVLFFSDGGLFGGLDLVGSETTDTATVKSEPGVTCTVRGLATALNRIELGCARCQYLVEWP